MFHDAITAVCSACLVSASNPCLINSKCKYWRQSCLRCWYQCYRLACRAKCGPRYSESQNPFADWPTKRKTSLESEGVHKYLRDWDKFTLKDKILYRYSNLYSEKVSQLVLPPVYRDVVFKDCMMMQDIREEIEPCFWLNPDSTGLAWIKTYK